MLSKFALHKRARFTKISLLTKRNRQAFDLYYIFNFKFISAEFQKQLYINAETQTKRRNHLLEKEHLSCKRSTSGATSKWKSEKCIRSAFTAHLICPLNLTSFKWYEICFSIIRGLHAWANKIYIQNFAKITLEITCTVRVALKCFLLKCFLLSSKWYGSD